MLNFLFDLLEFINVIFHNVGIMVSIYFELLMDIILPNWFPIGYFPV